MFPEEIISRLFKEMCHLQQEQKFLKDTVDPTGIGKQAFFKVLSHCMKKGDWSGHVLYVLSADADQMVTSVEMEGLCMCLLDSYSKAFKQTVPGTQWKLETDTASNELFAKMAIQELLGEKENPSCVSVVDVKAWLARFPLIQHVLVATMRACFFGVEDLVEEAHHGLSEGCQETVEHVHYDK